MLETAAVNSGGWCSFCFAVLAEEVDTYINMEELQPPQEKREKIYPKLSSDLDRLVEAENIDAARELAEKKGYCEVDRLN